MVCRFLRRNKLYTNTQLKVRNTLVFNTLYVRERERESVCVCVWHILSVEAFPPLWYRPEIAIDYKLQRALSSPEATYKAPVDSSN